MSNVKSELAKVLKLKQKDGEDLDAYARRLAVAANKIPDDAWETLSEPVQLWVNDALKAIEKKEDLPALTNGEDVEVASSEKEADPGEAAEGSEQEAPAQSEESEVAKKSVKASPKKKATVVKPKKSVATKASAKAKTKVKATSPKTSGKRGPKGPYAADLKIKVLVKNPKREGTATAKQFDKYKTGMTVAEAGAAGFSAKSLSWDSKHGFIKIG